MPPPRPRRGKRLRNLVTEEIAALKTLVERRSKIDEYDYAVLESDSRLDTSPEVQQVRRLGAAADRTFDRCLKKLMGREPAPASSARPPAPECKTKPTAPAPPAAVSGGLDLDPAWNDDEAVLPIALRGIWRG